MGQSVRTAGEELLFRARMRQDTDEALQEMGEPEQKEMIRATNLPIMGSINSKESRAQLETLGFVFGKEVDKIFVEATLPEGWKIKSTSRYWSSLLDEKDRDRGHIFFKPEFYDRNAFMSLRQRYTAGCDMDHDWLHEHQKDYEDWRDAYNDMPFSAVVTDFDGTDLYRFGPLIPRQLKVDWRQGFMGQGLEYDLKTMAKAWIKGHYPDWENPAAYWD